MNRTLLAQGVWPLAGAGPEPNPWLEGSGSCSGPCSGAGRDHLPWVRWLVAATAERRRAPDSSALRVRTQARWSGYDAFKRGGDVVPGGDPDSHRAWFGSQERTRSGAKIAIGELSA